MITKKLYYEDAYLSEFTAVVQNCIAIKDRFEIELDQTCFYPEGGGQPGDIGWIGEIPVFDTHIREERIWHYTKEALEPGTRIEGKVDWNRRFDYMQQHSGEHLISGIVHEQYGYDNVGFHMGAEVTTIDFNGELSMDQLLNVERKVNALIWKNSEVKIWYPDEAERSTLPFRSKKEIKEAVRLVEFPDADLCACCGTHVRRTGEIGLAKIISCEKFHSGVRLEILCGKRAAEYLGGIFEQNREISQKLSAKPLETAQAVENLLTDQNDKRMQIYSLEETLFFEKAKELTGKGDVVVFFDELSADGVRRACDAIQKTCMGRCAVFSGTDETGYKYAVGKPEGNLTEFVKKMNSALHGRGGGKPFFVQGSVTAGKNEILRFFDNIE